MTEPTCDLYWGVHACRLIPGHTGLHSCVCWHDGHANSPCSEFDEREQTVRWWSRDQHAWGHWGGSRSYRI